MTRIEETTKMKALTRLARPFSASQHELRVHATVQAKDAGSVACGARERLRTQACTVACLGLAFLAVLLLPSSARAEFGVVPGSVIAKAHPPVPLLHLPELSKKVPARARYERIADRPGILAAPFVSRAGDHPDATGSGKLADRNFHAKDFFINTPPGFLGNPTAVPACDRTAFLAFVENALDGCSPASQVGVATTKINSPPQPETSPVYRLTAAPGHPASFGFRVLTFGILVNANLRTDEDYGIVLGASDITTAAIFEATTVTLWGVPADPIHDPDRWDPTEGNIFEGLPVGDWGVSPGLSRIPFIQTPTDCSADRLITTATIASWQDPGNFLPENPLDPDYAIPAPQPTGCDGLSFKPTIALIPSATNSDSPTGVSVQLDVPQNEDPDGRSTPQLRKAVVTLPEGMSVNPAAADGIEGCSTAQIGLLTTHGAYPNPIRFAKGDPSCPQASKVGAGVVNTALLDDPLQGDVYLATPHDNPFHSLLALYLVLRGPGFTVKVAGEVEADPVTGRLTTTFDHSPQLPFDKLSLNFFGGPRAPLATSPLCGTQTIATTLTPWSAPQSGPPATPDNRYEATQGPAGAPCSFSEASRPFAPELTAGTASPIAGGFSAMTMRLTRPDGHQPLAGLTVRPPRGFTAVLAGVPYCSEARIAAAAQRTGRAESAFPSCPAASRLGSLLTGAGAGPTPLFTAGDAYLAGPYAGAPLSLVTITPALAGGTPGNEVFDLGTVVVRVALHVDSRSAQITAVSDPVPQTLEGIPLRIRDIRVNLDRPEWGINPTSCAEKSFEVDATGQNGATASLSNRFQAVECRALGFKPRLHTRLIGATGRGGHPKFRAVLVPRAGDANISRVAVSLPRSEFLDQAHIRTVCTRVQFAAESCPKGAVYGHAVAFSPLLGKPLKGPVYLRSSDNLLPDLVAALKGPASQPIEVDLVGRIDSVRGGIRTTFEAAPDAQVSKFVLTMQGGKKGLLINSRDLCARPSRVIARFKGQNGKAHNPKPLLKNDCGKQRKAKRSSVR